LPAIPTTSHPDHNHGVRRNSLPDFVQRRMVQLGDTIADGGVDLRLGQDGTGHGGAISWARQYR